MPHPALGGLPARRALSERLLTRALSQLSLSSPATSTQPRRAPAAAAPGWTCASCKRLSKSTAAHFHTSSASSASSASSSQWKARQARDPHARLANVMKLKSRAAFKLLELDAKHRLFRRNQVVVDLGYAPGSWSQVAVERTKPHGVVVGIDLIPAQPPRGATSIQGDFLSPQVRRLVREVCAEQVRRRRREAQERRAMDRRFEGVLRSEGGVSDGDGDGDGDGEGSRVAGEEGSAAAGEEAIQDRPSYIDMEKMASHDIEVAEAKARTDGDGRMVDVIISDMLEPWPQTSGFSVKTLSRPYRLMNTSGMAFRDHAGSMDLCYAALAFASDNLKHGGNFVCKFYQGSEDKLLQTKLQKMFTHVHTDKPAASRNSSKEAYFVALGRKGSCTLAGIEGR